MPAMIAGRFVHLRALFLTQPYCMCIADEMTDPLQGDDCSLAIDIDRCVVNLESGSPLLFGMPSKSAR